MEATIRFSCPTLPFMESSEIAFRYFSALEEMGFHSRVAPIGVTHMGMAPWNAAPEALMRPLPASFINVVCAPFGLYLGAQARQAALATRPGELEGFALSLQSPKVDSSPIVYRPRTAIDAIWTEGMKNIAIITKAGSPTIEEKDRLPQYDLVISAEENEIGSRVVFPDDRESLFSIFSAMKAA